MSIFSIQQRLDSGEVEKLGKRGKKNVPFQGKNDPGAPMFDSTLEKKEKEL